MCSAGEPLSQSLGTVLHVAHGIHLASGGPGYSILRQCHEGAAAGWRQVLVALDLGGEVAAPPGVEMRLYRPSVSVRWGYSRRLSQELPQLISRADIVHTHFLWSEPMWAAWRHARRMGKPLIVQPQGGLLPAALGRRRPIKWLSFQFQEGPALRHATLIMATSEDEASELARLRLETPVHIVPHGVAPPDDLPTHDDARRSVLAELGLPPASRYWLYLGRIHPHKQVEVLVKVLPLVRDSASDPFLILVGPFAGGVRDSLTRLSRRLGVEDRVRWRGPAFGADKWRYLSGADLLALPSRSENFGLVVAEALAAGTPAVASRGSPWRVLEEQGLGRWVTADVPCFAEAIKDVLLRTATGCDLRQRCRDFAEAHLSTAAMRNGLSAAYARALRPPI